MFLPIETSPKNETDNLIIIQLLKIPFILLKLIIIHVPRKENSSLTNISFVIRIICNFKACKL